MQHTCWQIVHIEVNVVNKRGKEDVTNRGKKTKEGLGHQGLPNTESVTPHTSNHLTAKAPVAN